MEKQKNWAGNLIYQARQWHEPASIEEIQAIVRQANKVRVVGSRHSFNEIADSEDAIISLVRFNRILSLDRQQQTVTIEGGVRYGELSAFLQDQGLPYLIWLHCRIFL
ncbi:FAD-binding oxidoreductase [Gracilibacillus phocaeensis]|uniref:FAD-binding oxidoreductase n=1 Tax=Gracilibacillus phocaeensis TaxID=2042304 RepID=UPI0025712E1A|nr:FAD-dependent oxidoreductase [Gracilibacillus phocaeensis]